MNGSVRSKVKNIKELLRDSLDADCEILKEKYTMLTPPGEHYGSIMLAVDMTVRKPSKNEEVLHLVAKLVPSNQMLKIAFNTAITFKKEVRFYLELVPALLDLQSDFQVPNADRLDTFPKCLGARIALDENKNEVDDDAAIVFENLKTQGYVMEDRLVGFDVPHGRMIVKDLANLHATAIALRQLRPDDYNKRVRVVLDLAGTDVSNLPKEFLDVIYDKLGDAGVSEYLDRVKASYEIAVQDALNEFQPINPLFETIVHSDYWVNNTLVLRDSNGRPLKNKMVDWQLTRSGTGLRDLFFFLHTSIQDALLDDNLDDLVRLYYNEFVNVLKHYKLDAPYTWECFQKEWEYVAVREAFHVIFMIKPIFTERGKITNSLEDFDDNDFTRSDLLGENYNRKLGATVLRLAERKWI